jgi:uncharacterized protein
VIGRAVASVGIKAALAAVVGVLTKSPEAGVATFVALSWTQQVDTRSWRTLPAEFQLVRIPLVQGPHSITIHYGKRMTTHDVRIEAGKVKLLVIRRY